MTVLILRKNLKRLDEISPSFYSSVKFHKPSHRTLPIRSLGYSFLKFPNFTWALETLVSFLSLSSTPTHIYGKNNRKNNRCNQNLIQLGIGLIALGIVAEIIFGQGAIFGV